MRGMGCLSGNNGEVCTRQMSARLKLQEHTLSHQGSGSCARSALKSFRMSASNIEDWEVRLAEMMNSDVRCDQSNGEGC